MYRVYYVEQKQVLTTISKTRITNTRPATIVNRIIHAFHLCPLRFPRVYFFFYLVSFVTCVYMPTMNHCQ